ncbi:YdcF family protein [Adhaeribacter swui]|uniref:YdcF family protein n=1 Tax=Adhaeribacter swui TaxID=2086471 RepID=A0A7G7GA80_9BACT|nr:YdcF family protein [Adhaeribacter swui]QNF34064.1 YdcF family protein [Adhaeribacter swui]
MFFIFSKILFYVALPVVWLVALLFYAAFTNNKRRRRLVIKFLAILVAVLTNPYLINEAWLAWELPPKPLAEVPVSDAGIILTGITSLQKSPHDRVYIERGADRLLHTLWLYHEKKIRKIIISGGSGSIQSVYSTEAMELKKILLQAGVPENVILLEDQSHNTRENALFTAQLMQKNPDIRSAVLITSAFHMRRAAACFKKAGLQPVIFPADFYSIDRSYLPQNIIVPSAAAFANWHLLLHEIMGFVTYKILGYC